MNDTRWIIVRTQTRADGEQERLIVGVFPTGWEAEHALPVFRDAHPENVIGPARFDIAMAVVTRRQP